MNKRTTLLPFFLVLLLSACYPLAQSAETDASTVEPITILPSTSITKASATPLPTSTITPTNSPQPPTPTITSTAQPTPTTLPPFTNDTAKTVLGRLMQENGGCQLPCVLGITPGVSTQSELDNFIQYFQDHFHESDDLIDNVNVGFYIEDPQRFASVYFFTDTVGVSVHASYEISQGIVQRASLSSEAMQYSEISNTSDGSAKKLFGDDYFLELLGAFTLPEVLNTYGLPARILIRPYPDYPGYPSPPAQYTFSFVLDYSERGFLIEYITKREEQDDQYFGCPSIPYHLQITSWNQSESLTLEQTVESFSNLDGITIANWDLYKPIENVTPLTPEQFAEIYQDATTDECVYTMKEIWPTVEP